MKRFCRALAVILSIGMLSAATSGCSAAGRDSRRIVRIGHNQATDHPTHIALLAFEK